MNDSAQPKPPDERTLKQYGMTSWDWLQMLERQGWVCPICKKPIVTKTVVTDGKRSFKTNANIDHRHASKWKKMPPEERKKYVRGILCQFCNRFYMCKAMTVEKAKNIVFYLAENHDELTVTKGK